MRKYKALVALVPFLLAGCEVNYLCVSVNPFIVQVTVYDSATGVLLPAASGVVTRLATGTAQDHDARALTSTGQAVLSAGGQPGRYAVRISHDGYATWEATDIVVRDDGNPCHQVETVKLEARLSRGTF